MPNRVSSRMIVIGLKAELARFKETIAGPDDADDADEQTAFSFEKIVPYPAGFDKTVTSGSVTYDMSSRMGKAGGKPMTDEQYELEYRENARKHEWGRTEEQLQEEIAKARSERVRARKNIEIAGHPTWYEWNTEHWGTKWGAYDVALSSDQNVLTYEFQTAWTLPEPIFEALARQFPTLEIKVECCEEDGFFCGTWLKRKTEKYGKFYDAPYPKNAIEHCPYHGNHAEWFDDEEEEVEA